MTPLERRAALRAAVIMRRITMNQAAQEMGISYNHLTLVLRGERKDSARLEQAISALLGQPRENVFPLKS